MPGPSRPEVNPQFEAFTDQLPKVDMGELSSEAAQFLVAFVEYLQLLPEDQAKQTMRRFVAEFRRLDYLGRSMPLDVFDKMGIRGDGTTIGIPNEMIRNISPDDLRKALQGLIGNQGEPNSKRNRRKR